MILFDTDVCIEILRGNERIIRQRSDYDGDIAVSFMSAAELYYGAEKSNMPADNKVLIEEFLLSVEIIHTDLDILEKFGSIKERLENTGNTLADTDIFIASVALTKCDRLITGNVRHYNRIEELKIENWLR
jgi:tRNA(fMet)-specific endonuclease VapC